MSYVSEHRPGIGRLCLLLGANAAIFAATLVASAFGIDLLSPLVLVKGAAADWRLVTYAFAHTDFLHFCLNMVVLLAVGSFATALNLSRDLVPVYVAGAVCGAAAFLSSAPEGAVLAGSSAAVLAVVTANTVWLRDVHLMLPGNYRPTMGAVAIPFILLSIANSLLFSAPGAKLAHLAGIFAGALIATAFYKPVRNLLLGARRSREERLRLRRRALQKIRVSGFSSLNQNEKDSL